MTCQERVECLKAAVPAVVLCTIAFGCMAGVILILTGHLAEYAPYMDKLIGALMVVAGLQNEPN